MGVYLINPSKALFTFAPVVFIEKYYLFPNWTGKVIIRSIKLSFVFPSWYFIYRSFLSNFFSESYSRIDFYDKQW